jgi:hypothetical protein
MNNFGRTEAGAAFIATAARRETSEEIMEAIAFFARNEDEAVAIWQGDGLGRIADLIGVWEHATGNGRIDDNDLTWGGRKLVEIMAENA